MKDSVLEIELTLRNNCFIPFWNIKTLKPQGKKKKVEEDGTLFLIT